MCERDNIEITLREIRAGIEKHSERVDRDPSSVRLVVVTKTHGTDTIRLLAGLGEKDLGESYVDEFRVKYPECRSLDLRWHFIGHLFRKHTPKVVGKAALIHSVDTLRLARKIDLTAGQMEVRQDVLLQVNTSGEDRKQGFSPEELLARELIEELKVLGNIEVKGLMTMAPYTDDEAVLRSCFGGLRECMEELRERSGWDLRELSMGMSGDYGIAVEEGATMVRIGTAILGERRRR